MDIRHPLYHMIKAVISLLVTISFLASLLGGLCSDVHAESTFSIAAGSQCANMHENSRNTAIPCDPANESYPEGGHCDDCCGCSCFRTAVTHLVDIKYSPFVASLFSNEPFTALPEVFIPKFVPPERLT